MPENIQPETQRLISSIFQYKKSKRVTESNITGLNISSISN